MIPIPLTADLVHGAAELEPTDRGLRPHRLPRRVVDRYADQQLAMVEAQPSGVRLAFTTTAEHLALVLHASRVAYEGISRPRGAVDVLVDGELLVSHQLAAGDLVELALTGGAPRMTAGDADRVEVTVPAGLKTVELWLPHNEQVDLVVLEADAAVAPVAPAGPIWVHHGSSISHGSNATSPTAIWPVVTARGSGLHLRNLGFGGSALVDPFVAREIRDTPADLITLKLGINVVNLDAMHRRAFVPAVHGFLDTIRDGHPTTPLWLISPIFCGIHERTPGPGSIDPASFARGSLRFTATGDPADVARGRLTLEVIREALQEVVRTRSDDGDLHYLEGLELYGPEDAERLPLPDGLHPDTETHRLIGERFSEILAGTR